MRNQVTGDVFSINLDVFREDDHGRSFGDILAENRKELSLGLAVMNSAHAQLRMEDSELHHDRPAFSGIVRDLEKVEAIREVLKKKDGRGDRLKMALGTAARIVMEGRGWQKLGRKSAVGVGEFFTRAERYEKP